MTLSNANDKDKQEIIDKAIALAIKYGSIDGDHHRAWVIDQMVRVLAGDDYERLISEECTEDGEIDWYTGIAP